MNDVVHVAYAANRSRRPLRSRPFLLHYVVEMVTVQQPHSRRPKSASRFVGNTGCVPYNNDPPQVCPTLHGGKGGWWDSEAVCQQPQQRGGSNLAVVPGRNDMEDGYAVSSLNSLIRQFKTCCRRRSRVTVETSWSNKPGETRSGDCRRLDLSNWANLDANRSWPTIGQMPRRAKPELHSIYVVSRVFRVMSRLGISLFKLPTESCAPLILRRQA